MSHAIVELMAVWVFSASTPMAVDDLWEGTQTSGFIVIERLDETTVSIETREGIVDLPRGIFPETELHEGMVIEWRVNEAEEQQRLEDAQARIERLRTRF